MTCLTWKMESEKSCSDTFLLAIKFFRYRLQSVVGRFEYLHRPERSLNFLSVFCAIWLNGKINSLSSINGVVIFCYIVRRFRKIQLKILIRNLNVQTWSYRKSCNEICQLFNFFMKNWITSWCCWTFGYEIFPCNLMNQQSSPFKY